MHNQVTRNAFDDILETCRSMFRVKQISGYAFTLIVVVVVISLVSMLCIIGVKMRTGYPRIFQVIGTDVHAAVRYMMLWPPSCRALGIAGPVHSIGLH